MSAAEPPPAQSLEVDGNRLTLLPTGPGRLQALLALIDGAKKSVRLLYYIYAQDQSGTLVYEALERALDRGAQVALLVDGFGLTAGESLADRGLVLPWQAMWAPNIVLTVLGLIGLVRVSRESGSTRGGDFREMIEGLAHLIRRLRRAVQRR